MMTDSQKLDLLLERTGKVEIVIKEIQSDNREIKSDINELQSDYKGMKSDINELQSDYKGMKSDILALTENFILLKNQLDVVEKKIADVDARLLSLDEGITSIEDEIKFIRFTIENQIDHSIRVVAEGHSILNRRINAMEEKTSNVEELIIRCDVLEMKIKEMMRQSAV